ncbi:GbsR/MarR family transcriptional regulator [Goodfellowiella coeruleoviolacea]|uniref:MarR family protein n=1 Tax=Goodfellowiella coeruleoviolacea TaxID=334858 RepID=A0AAE3GFL6_9PSEU|nr:MarR family transcriptional regulator [Goodfellowiella coeruleoviolacea]MCP2166818.1 MarR family protein [Goodfellowiella coeruleoviolacea]
MATDWELAFADDAGRLFARQYGLPPMTGRVIGWLLLCEPAQQTIGELSEALRASRTAVTTAISTLEDWSWVRRSRAAGERVDRVWLDPDVWLRLVDNTAEHTALGELARRGLDAMSGESAERRARLAELAEFAAFLAERMPALAAEWRARQDALRTGQR